MDVPRTHELHQRGGVLLLVRRDWSDALPLSDLLAGAEAEAWGRPVEHRATSGRGGQVAVETSRGRLLVKRLARGGLLRGLLPTRFFDRERPFREAALAEALAERGCRTPAVVVARSRPAGPGLYTLDLATEQVVGALDLEAAWREVGSDEGRGRALAAAAGATVRRLHDAGLRHRDLNVGNLLVPRPARPEGDLLVLDLDRCGLGAPLDRAERVASLSRLGRSAVKRGLLAARLAPGSPCDAFFEAYGALEGLAPVDLRDLAGAHLRRRLWAHRLLWGLSRP